MSQNQNTTPSATTQPVQIDDMTFGTAPNILTLVRMGFVPIIVYMLSQNDPRWDMAAAWTFGAASITDYFDGYWARTRKLITVYGKLLDPLADKFIVVAALIMLQQVERIPPSVTILLICREMAITSLRALASAEGVIIPASGSGKWKTATQMVALPFMMAKQGLWGIPTFQIGQVLLYFSLAVSLWSAKDYVVDFFRAAREARKHKQHERQLMREARKAQRSARMEARAKKNGAPR